MGAIDLLFEQELLRRRAQDKNLSTERIYKGQNESKERIYEGKNRADVRGYQAVEYKAGAEAQAKFYEDYIKALTMVSEFDGKNPKRNIFKRGNSYYERPMLTGGTEEGLYGEETEISMQEYLRLEKANINTTQLRNLVMQGYLPGKIKAGAEYDATEVARAKNTQQTDKSQGEDPPRKVEVDDKNQLKVNDLTVQDIVKADTGHIPEEFYKVENESSSMLKLGFDPRNPISGLISRNENYDPTQRPGSAQLQKIKPNYPEQYKEGLSKGYQNVGDPKTDMLTRTKGGITAGSMPPVTFSKSVDAFSQLTDKQNANLVKQHKQAMADGLIEEGENVEVNAQGKLVFRQK